MPKSTATEIGNGSFDQPDLQLLDDCTIIFFGLVTEILGIWRAYNVSLERSWKYLSSGILHAPQKIEIWVEKQK